MQIHAVRFLETLPVVAASRVLVTDDHGNPLVAVVRAGPGYQVLPAGSPGFAAALRLFGAEPPEVRPGPDLGPGPLL